MNQDRLDKRDDRAGSKDLANRQLSLGIVTFTLVFTVGFLITNWLAFVPAN